MGKTHQVSCHTSHQHFFKRPVPFGASNNHVVITLFRVIENFLRNIPLEMLNRYLYSSVLSGRYRFVHHFLIFPSYFFQSLYKSFTGSAQKIQLA